MCSSAAQVAQRSVVAHHPHLSIMQYGLNRLMQTSKQVILMQIIKIPSERVSALMGRSGETKDYLEQRMKVTITVDSDGAVVISGEPIDEFIGKDVVRAIGRGFEPAIALKLLSDDYGLRVIDLRDYVTKREGLVRIKGRVIGEKGRTKEIINEEVGAFVAVWGHTVAVISQLET